MLYKEGVQYKLIGYQVIGIDYNSYREEIAEYKKGYWYPVGSNKHFGNFVINQIIEI